MRGTTVDLIQTTAGGVSATIARHIAQAMNAASSKTVAAMAMRAGAAIATEIGTEMATVIGESTAVAMEATADMDRMPLSSTAIRTESMMARVTGAAATAIVQRRTAITNTPTVATAQATATRIITNKPIVRRMNADTRKVTSVAAAGAGTSSNRNDKAMRRIAWLFYFLSEVAVKPLVLPSGNTRWLSHGSESFCNETDPFSVRRRTRAPPWFIFPRKLELKLPVCDVMGKSELKLERRPPS